MMFFANTIKPDTLLEPRRCSLLRGIDFQKELTFEEIRDIANSPYSNENWSKLSYFVCKSSIRPYHNDDLGKIVERNITNRDWMIDEMSVNCLLYETSLRMPTVCDWTRHFSFFTSDNFIGSIGIYALQLSTNTSEHLAIKQIANIAQYQLNTNSPFNRFLVAIQKEDNWEIAFGDILAAVTPRKYVKARKVKITLCKEPSKFFNEFLGGGRINNIIHEEFEIRVRT